MIYSLISFYNNFNNSYVVVSNQKIIGFVSLSNVLGKHYLSDVFVKPKYRHKGIGTCLVQEIIKKSSKPIYVNANPHLALFFTGFGFKQRTYSVFRFWLRKDGYPGQLVFYPEIF